MMDEGDDMEKPVFRVNDCFIDGGRTSKERIVRRYIEHMS